MLVYRHSHQSRLIHLACRDYPAINGADRSGQHLHIPELHTVLDDRLAGIFFNEILFRLKGYFPIQHIHRID
jgi:hypothetical protein